MMYKERLTKEEHYIISKEPDGNEERRWYWNSIAKLIEGSLAFEQDLDFRYLMFDSFSDQSGVMEGTRLACEMYGEALRHAYHGEASLEQRLEFFFNKYEAAKRSSDKGGAAAAF